MIIDLVYSNLYIYLFHADGYTVSDVVMYWREKPVVGVEEAELPQFTIEGHETNERKIRLATGNLVALKPNQIKAIIKYSAISQSFSINITYFISNRNVPALVFVIQTST